MQGTVLDNSNSAIPHANVRLAEPGSSDAINLRTDEKGRFAVVIEPERYYIDLQAEGFAPLRDIVEVGAGEDVTKTFHLQPLPNSQPVAVQPDEHFGVLTGTLKDPNDAVITSRYSHLAIEVQDQAAPQSSTRLGTDDHGDFWAKLPPGKYLVTVRAPGFQTRSSLVEISAGKTTTRDFVLPVAAMINIVDVARTDAGNASAVSGAPATLSQTGTKIRLTGTISDPVHAPIPGAKLSVTRVGDKRSAAVLYTNAKGGFAVLLPGGDYLITAEMDGFISQKISVSLRKNKSLPSLHVVLTVDGSHGEEIRPVVDPPPAPLPDHIPQRP